jgi:hypothetical protein
MMRGVIPVFVLTAIVELLPAPAAASRESEALRARAAFELYSLDRDQAMATYRQAVAADPQDASAYTGLASALWLSITFARGNMTVDDYLGRIARSNTPPPPPPANTAAAFRDAIDRALALARARLDVNADDAEAHYQIGTAIGLRASYVATVEGRLFGAFRAAREAYDEHEKVIALDGRRKDAGLIVGTYRYIVSTLARPARWVAYMAGFGGGKERGLRMIEDAAAYPGQNQTDAKVALVLLYNREKRYDEAMKVLDELRRQFPRNRLLWLETASTSLRAGRPADAARFLDEGFARFAQDSRARMFGEDALWYYKRGLARAGLHRNEEAAQDLRKSLGFEGRKWVHGRAHLELGKLALQAGDGAAARPELQAAIVLADADNDGATAEEARRLATR